jgi:hypothetical protein
VGLRRGGSLGLFGSVGRRCLGDCAEDEELVGDATIPNPAPVSSVCGECCCDWRARDGEAWPDIFIVWDMLGIGAADRGLGGINGGPAMFFSAASASPFPETLSARLLWYLNMDLATGPVDLFPDPASPACWAPVWARGASAWAVPGLELDVDVDDFLRLRYLASFEGCLSSCSRSELSDPIILAARIVIAGITGGEEGRKSARAGSPLAESRDVSSGYV